MGCNCGKRRGSAAAAPGETRGYRVTYADGTTSGIYLTVLEAKSDVREAGGGTIKRVLQSDITVTATPTQTV